MIPLSESSLNSDLLSNFFKSVVETTYDFYSVYCCTLASWMRQSNQSVWQGRMDAASHFQTVTSSRRRAFLPTLQGEDGATISSSRSGQRKIQIQEKNYETSNRTGSCCCRRRPDGITGLGEGRPLPIVLTELWILLRQKLHTELQLHSELQLPSQLQSQQQLLPTELQPLVLASRNQLLIWLRPQRFQFRQVLRPFQSRSLKPPRTPPLSRPIAIPHERRVEPNSQAGHSILECPAYFLPARSVSARAARAAALARIASPVNRIGRSIDSDSKLPSNSTSSPTGF